jgi:RND superfamily putative drug exporter
MHHKGFFYRFGECIYTCRWLVIVLWLFIIMACVPFAPKLMEPFKAIGFIDPQSQSAKANTLLDEKLGFSYNQIIVLYHSDKLLATSAKFQHEIEMSLADLKHFPLKHRISYPTIDNKQISADNHTAYAVLLLKGDKEMDDKTLDQLRVDIKEPKELEMHVGGEPIFLNDTKIQTQIDLYKSEYIATPVAIVTMLIVFGSVVAASLPVLLGGVCAFLMLTVLYFLGHAFTLSVFTLNIALLLGLCLSLDYALLIVNRFRDELAAGRAPKEALAVTQATAGKSVFFSGLAVFISLSALLLFRLNVLFSVGMGGLAAVTVSILVAIVLLPAILGVLNHRINYLRVPFFHRHTGKTGSYWYWIVTKVVKRPLIYFSVTLIILLSLGYPFLDAKFGFSDFKILPKNLESRQVFDSFEAEFGDSKLSPIFGIVTAPDDNILTKSNIRYLHHFVNTIKKDPRVDSVLSIVSVSPDLDTEKYAALYAEPRAYLTPQLKEFLKNTTRGDITMLTIFSKYPGDDPRTQQLIRDLRKLDPDHDMTVNYTGSTVNTLDALKSIAATFPWAFAWIVCFTYIVLLVSLRSFILPLKAILTAMLSLFSSYGVLTLVIQKGYLHQYLDFQPQGMLDISLLIIIFCALFGISMDYEVFLLTRIKEYYEKTHDNINSIVMGIDRSCRIISSAAIIVVLICFSFMSAQILIVKAFGLGIAVAVFVDAFIIRTILVPATMTLLGKWNWYLPQWLGKILPKISFDPEK